MALPSLAHDRFGAVLVRHIGPSLFFPTAGALVVVAILGGLTQREFREFGARTDGDARDARPREPKDADIAWSEEPLASQRARHRLD